MKLQTNPIKQYLLIVLALILISSCTGDGNNSSPELKRCKKKIETLEKEIRDLKEQLGAIGNTAKPKNIIHPDFATEMYQLYDQREDMINEVVGTDGEGSEFKATRSLWYGIDNLYNYLGYIKDKSSKAQVEPTGFRFYFALYPDDYIRNDKDKKYAKRQTVFIAPTKEVTDAAGNVEHLGYTLDDDYKVVLLQDKFNTTPGKGKPGKKYQKAAFFNFSALQGRDGSDGSDGDNSTVANELQGSPPNN